MTSQARIDANRQNARKSSGPRSPEGKERAKMNALKHGLRAQEVVLPTESRDDFNSYLAAWMNDWKPPTEARRYLVERAVAASWKLRRSQRNETSRLTDRIKKAEVDWDRAYKERVEAAVRNLKNRPEQSVAFLSSSRRGLECLAELWHELVTALSDPECWNSFEEHHNPLCYLLGITGEDDPEPLTRISDASYGLMLRAQPKADIRGIPRLDDAGADRARAMLREVCREQIDAIIVRFRSLPVYPEARAIEAERIGTEVRAEDALQHRYEARLEREVRNAMKDLGSFQKTGLDLVEEDEVEAPNEAKATASEAPNEAKATASVPEAPNEAKAVPGQGLITQVDHDPMGVVVDVPGVTYLPISMVGPPSDR